MRARSGKRNYLGGDTFSLEHLLAIHNVTMSRNRDIEIARVVQARIPFAINRDPDYAVAAAKCAEILGRIEMIVNVDQVSQLARR
jgi:hypothetical protein